ncbi:PadR family transcriptional regulator [Mycoplasmatota bacterium zrk1]
MAMQPFRRDRRTPDFILLFLLQQPLHGFDLYKKINKVIKTNKVDTAGIYRTLDKLEKENMVSFIWVKGDKGPDKKLYSITKGGETFLKEAHENAQKTLFDLMIFTETYKGIMSKR